MMKMKKIFGLFCGVAAMMSMAACSSEEGAPEQVSETVTFTAQLPGKFTRAVADGAKANTLICYVYDADGKYVTKDSGSMSKNEGSVTMRLASGVNYKLVFWSQVASESSPYSITDAGVLTVNYTKMQGNDDNNDAFYYATTFKGGDEPTKIIMKRPLAQINFGTNDMGLDVVNKAYGENVRTTVTVDAYNTMNLVTGEVTGSATSITTSLASANKLTNGTFPAADNKYLNMAYVLVPKGGDTSMLTLKAYNSDAADATPVCTVQVPSAPLKPNFRTNVYGPLLTTNTGFEVKIEGGFDGDVNKPQPQK